MREDLRNDQSLNPVDDVEAALVKLQPRRTSINRDRLLFLAGQAAGAAERSSGPPKRRWAWPLTTFASVAAMLVFAVLFGIERRRERPVRMVVKYDRGPEAVSPNPLVVKLPRRDRPAKPQAEREEVVVATRSADSLAMESRMLRSRHPVLMTDLDLLPNPAPSGGRGSAEALSVGDTRRVMSDGLSATRSTTPPPSGFPSILNHFRFGRGGL